MIFYSEKPLKSWQPNLMMLDLNNDLGHIYVTRSTYDQAILISDRFSHDIELVNAKLDMGNCQDDAVYTMNGILPSPINILTPFYRLIEGSVFLDCSDMKTIIGVLSYISMSIDFNMMLKVDKQIRANLIFTKSILLDWQKHFEDFTFTLKSNVDSDEKVSSNTGKSDKSGSTNSTTKVKEENICEDGFIDIASDELDSWLSAVMGSTDVGSSTGKDTSKSTKEKTTTTTTTTTTNQSSIYKTKADEKKDEKNDVNNILSSFMK